MARRKPSRRSAQGHDLQFASCEVIKMHLRGRVSDWRGLLDK